MAKAVFLDKDGTLIPDIPYNVDPALITIQPDAIEGLQRLQQDGYKLIIISNQAGVARGLFSESMLPAVESCLRELLKVYEISLSGFYYCPHHPEGKVENYAIDCDCRKPKPGMLLKAANKHHIDLKESWMIGDILNDVEAGNRAGCKTILINNGNETEWLTGPMRAPTYICSSINQAAKDILHMQLA
ncbi:D-glycero-alpha-D-manno-heptose-1,7-bisphosphate 7-phosphatase [Mucilaginibacter terrae]|uniref:D,D-heptose 1,7-bisphosphate phosphatase n=1 Tax=Mucilaginibacter terrae TaxID=1955052 RepID=A0ABU3GZV7_9SPHI|nr:HAD family hydrolase [Mucilaginibacter terrae]MDT3405297.1 D-glycero-D-manno-heptose 1,7-bisphosphate phosphatase [Mucilaginibacter terrae]